MARAPQTLPISASVDVCWVRRSDGRRSALRPVWNCSASQNCSIAAALPTEIVSVPDEILSMISVKRPTERTTSLPYHEILHQRIKILGQVPTSSSDSTCALGQIAFAFRDILQARHNVIQGP